MKRYIFLLLPFIFLSGCSKQIHLNTFADSDSIPYGFEEGTSFFVSPQSENSTILTKEITKKIARVLKEKNYRVTSDKKSADYCLFFAYDMRSEQRTIQTFEQVGKTIVESSGNSYGHGHSRSHTHAHGHGCADGCWHEDTSTHSSYTDATHHNDEVVATQMGYVSRDVMFFIKTLSFQIYDAKAYNASGVNQEIWHGDAIIDDEDGDLRNNIDFLVIASLEKLGMNTHRTMRVTLKNSDKRVKGLRIS